MHFRTPQYEMWLSFEYDFMQLSTGHLISHSLKMEESVNHGCC